VTPSGAGLACGRRGACRVTDRQYGIESAFYFWDARRLNAIADADNVREVTTAVNGGLNGLPDREARLQRVKQALGM
jgi:predicted chitinase